MVDPYIVPFLDTSPALQEMTKGALNVLDNNNNGFFLMIEGGAIDWASHSNQPGRLIEEEIEFNKAVEAVVNWVENRSNWNETIVIVTGDHETGYLNGPNSGIDSEGESIWSLLGNNGINKLPDMDFYSGSHTNSLIPFYAQEIGDFLFLEAANNTLDPIRGHYLNNTDIGRILIGMLDKIEPEITYYPDNITYEFGSTESFYLTWNVDDIAPDIYNLYINDDFNKTDSWRNEIPINIDVSGMNVGSYKYTIEFYDIGKNKINDTKEVTIIDTTPPAWVSIPQSDVLFEYGFIEFFSLEAIDLSGILSWKMDNTMNFNISSNGVISNNHILEIGEYNIKIWVYDLYSNNQSITICIKLNDTICPEIIYFPSDLIINKPLDNITLNWTFTDLNPFKYELIINNNLTLEEFWNNNVISITLYDLQSIEYNITILCYDLSNNRRIHTI